MHQGKHVKAPSGLGRKRVALVASLLVVLALGCGGTIAWLTDKDQVKNTFSPGEVTTTVVENLDGNTKSNVKIKNTGSVDAWIRATVVITWQDEDGNVYGQLPVANTDYTIVWSWVGLENLDPSSSGQWVKGSDGFYYWTSPVAPEGLTGKLIVSCIYNTDKAPEGYSLTVEVIGSGIQSTPEDAFADWTDGKSGLAVSTDGGSLVKAGSSVGGGAESGTSNGQGN